MQAYLLLRKSRIGQTIAIVLAVFVFTWINVGFAQDSESTTRITNVVWSPDGTRVATSYRDGRILIDSLEGQQQPLLLQADTSRILGLAWSPDGQLLASGSTSPDNALRIWDTITGEQVHMVADFGLDILTVAWSPSGREVIAVTAEPFNSPQKDIVLDTTTWEIMPFQTATASWIAWSPNELQVAFAGIVNGIEVRDATSMQLLITYPYNNDRSGLGFLPFLVEFVWSSDGNFLAGGTGDGRVFVWRTDTPDPILTLEGNSYQGEDRDLAWINELYFDDSGQYLTSVSRDGTLRRWVLETGNLVAEQMIAPQYAADFSPYGGRLALGLASPENMAATDADLMAETIANGAVQILVPDPSIERLNDIAGACGAPVAPESSLSADVQPTDLTDYIAQVEALPADSIPPACAADLLAVARALEGGS